MLEIRQGDFEAFFAAPRHAYGPDSLYVSPFKADLRRFVNPRVNPLFAENPPAFFTVHRDGVPVGRIIAHVHARSNLRFGWRRAYFGFFDCADDLGAARLLLDATQRFASQRGCDELIGNFNLTAMQAIGVVTDGFDDAPYSDQIYNPPHVPALLRELGYETVFPMNTFEIDLECLSPDSLLTEKARECLDDETLRWEALEPRRMSATLESIRTVLNAGFDPNPMFVPLTADEIAFQARDLALVIDPRISTLVHDAQGAVGTVVCIPDLNPLLRACGSRFGISTPAHYIRFRRNRRRAVIIFYSVAPRRQNRGLNAAMLYRMTTALKAAGYTHLGGTWIAAENRASLRQMERLNARRTHELHLFRKAVSPCG